MTAHVITISREYGSGGRTIGELVAKELGYGFYDKVLIDLAAKKSGFAIDYIKNTEEQVTPNFLFNLAANGYYANTVFVNDGLPASDSLFIMQSKIIRELADKGPCVIVGRCADYILRERDDVLDAFIYADMDFRVKHMTEVYQQPEYAVPKWLKDRDNRRNVYYKHYTGRNWGDPQNYDVCLCTSRLGIEKAADMLYSIIAGE